MANYKIWILVIGILLGFWVLTCPGPGTFGFPAEAASVPQLINYQGMLTDRNNIPREGGFEITFAIWSHENSNEEGAYLKWREIQSTVYVRQGIFSVLLGSVDPIPTHIFGENKELWLGIKVGTDSEMRPRSQITTVGYAFSADRVQGQLPTDNVFPSSGNVGMGTPSPNYKLDVDGNASIDGATFVVNNAKVGIGTAEPTADLHIEGSLLLTGTIEGASPVKIAGGLNVLTGSVGIGTTDPGTYKLKVAGSMEANDVYIISVGGWLSEKF